MKALIGRVKTRLVDDWCHAWRWWSVRALALFGVLGSYILAAPETLVQVIAMLPPELRWWLPPLAGPVLTLLVFLLRISKQRDGK